MARVYLMVEDLPEGSEPSISFAVDWGTEDGQLPAEHTDAQYAVQLFHDVLRGKFKADAPSMIIVPQ
jgi:hypothetical protein